MPEKSKRRRNHGGVGAAPASKTERKQELLTRVSAVYQRNFVDIPDGRNRLANLGIADLRVLERHQLGYCDGRLPELLPKNDAVVREALRQLGILDSSDEETLRGCLVVPILDSERNLITLCGLKKQSRGEILLPGRPELLWNAPALKAYADLLVVDSIIDALSLDMAKASNVISILPGNPKPDLSFVKDYGIQTMRTFDPSLAGRLVVATGVRVHCTSLPGEVRPNAYLQTHGAEKLAQALAGSRDPKVDQALEAVADGFVATLGARRYQVRGLDKSARKLRATVRVEQGGKLHVDTLDFYAARWRRQLVQDLACLFEEPQEVLEAEVVKLLKLCEKRAESVTSQTAVDLPPMSEGSRQEAEAFGKSPELLKNIIEDYERIGLVGEKSNKLLCYLAMVSRKMERPLSVLILSSSGAGKSALQDATMKFCPPEDLTKLTGLSSKALFYKDRTSLKHKVLALEEGEGADAASYGLRSLVSAGELVLEVTVKDPASGKLTTMENRVEGPTAVFLTTTDPEIDPETRSRFFVTSVEESREQTQAILAFQRREQTLQGLKHRAGTRSVIELHHNFQRLLRPLSVVNPFAEELNFSVDRLQSRRDQPKYLNLIRAVAFLRQMQKQVQTCVLDGETVSFVEVEREDVRLATELANQVLGANLAELSGPARDLLGLVEQMVVKQGSREIEFTRRELREYTGWNHSRVHRYLRELIDLEYVVVTRSRGRLLQSYRLCHPPQGSDQGLLGLNEGPAS